MQLPGTSLRLRAGAVLFAVLVLLGIPSAIAQPTTPQGARIALVIGNSDYETVGTLPNPGYDATAMATALLRIGFDVTLILNADKSALEDALGTFAEAAYGAAMAIVYYAGHGIEVNGTNYLIPIDATLNTDLRVQFEAVALDDVLSATRGVNGVSLIILDACRENPFLSRMRSADPMRAIAAGRGLLPIEPGTTTVVAYAARGGTLAADGTAGAHSPFTGALLTYLETPGLDVRFLFGKVRDDVLTATGGQQEPWLYGALGGDPVYIVPEALAVIAPPTAPAPTLVGTPPDAGVAEAYAAALAVNTAAAWQAFLEHYPNGFFADLARQNLANLDRTPTTPAAPEIAALPAPATPAQQNVSRAPGSALTDPAIEVANLPDLGWGLRQVGPASQVDAMALSPDGRLIASGSRADETIRIWDVASGRSIAAITDQPEVTGVAFSPDNRTVITSNWNGSIRLFDAGDGRLIRTLGDFSVGGYVRAVAASPDGVHIAGAYRDGRLRVWNSISGRLVYAASGPATALEAIAYSPDGSLIAIADGADDKVWLWEADTGIPLYTLVGHTGDSASVTFSPDSRTLASASDDGTVRLWDTRSGALLRTIRVHRDDVTGVAFSPDGRSLATVSADQSIVVWNTSTGAELSRITGLNGGRWAIAYSPSGSSLIVAGAPGIIWFDAANGSVILRQFHLAGGLWLTVLGDAYYTGPEGAERYLRITVPGGEPRQMAAEERAAVFLPDGLAGAGPR